MLDKYNKDSPLLQLSGRALAAFKLGKAGGAKTRQVVWVPGSPDPADL